MEINIPKEIKSLRESLGLSQKDLCKLTGLSSQRVSNIESGRYKVKPETAQHIFNSMGYELKLTIEKIGPVDKQEALRSAIEVLKRFTE